MAARAVITADCRTRGSQTLDCPEAFSCGVEVSRILLCSVTSLPACGGMLGQPNNLGRAKYLSMGQRSVGAMARASRSFRTCILSSGPRVSQSSADRREKIGPLRATRRTQPPNNAPCGRKNAPCRSSCASFYDPGHGVSRMGDTRSTYLACQVAWYPSARPNLWTRRHRFSVGRHVAYFEAPDCGVQPAR
jgi:hypothetical protein